MCFLALVYKVVPGYPVVVAANRDELADRPSLPPREIRAGIWGGVDVVAGGTWLGVNAAGVVVGVANLRTAEPARPEARSRGLLCLDLLAAGSAGDIPGLLAAAQGRDLYNGFNLLAADAKSAGVGVSLGGAAAWRAFEPGVHIIGNSLPDSDDDPKVRRGRCLIMGAGTVEGMLGVLQSACRDHGVRPDGSDAICVHRERGVTRSSTIVALHESDPARHVYLFADSNPCRAEYTDMSGLLRKPAGPHVKEKGDDDQQGGDEEQ